MDHYDEERTQLAEDDEKLRIALEEARNGDWFEYDDEEDEEDGEEQLFIDLEAPSDLTAQSTSSGYVESGSRSHFMTIDEDSQDPRTTPAPPGISLPTSLSDTGSSDVEKTLALNRALQLILEGRIESIEAALESNREKQERLNDGAWVEMENKKVGKGRTWGPFRAPYFQTCGLTAYPADNEDTIMKRRSNELMYHSMREAVAYSKSAKQTLVEAVTEDTREKLMKPIMNRLEMEVKKSADVRNVFEERADDLDIERKKMKSLKQFLNELKERKPPDEEAIEQTLQEIEESKGDLEQAKEKLEKIQGLKMARDEKVKQVEMELEVQKEKCDEDILAKVDSSKVDWMKLSKMWFKEGTSWVDCQKAWDFIVDPKINLLPWSEEEETQLCNQVEELGNTDWTLIAQAIGNGRRTPYHCFYHYQNRFNPELKSRPWKKEEDLKLLDAVKKVRGTAAMFTWRKVATLVNSRSSCECSLRYSHIGNEKKFGRWSRAEDARLITAVSTMGFNWPKVARFMGKRTYTQCRERYKRCLNPNLNFFHFTYDEDQRMMRLVKEHGPKWVKIATFLSGRTDMMVKNRWSTLEKWKLETEWWNSMDESDKALLLGRNLSVKQRKELEAKGKLYFKESLGVLTRDYERQIKDRANGVEPDEIPARPPMHFKYHRLQNMFSSKRHSLWTKRLSLHHQLLDSMKKRYEENENLKNDKASKKKKVFYTAPKDKEDVSEEEELTKRVIDNTEEETTAQKFTIPKKTMKQMLSTLNQHFLGESSVRASELLKSSSMSGIKNTIAAHRLRQRVNHRLRNILAKNKWVFTRDMRHRHHILPKDERSVMEIEVETQNCKDRVPGMLLRKLGGDSVTLMENVKKRQAQATEDKMNLGSFTGDEKLKQRMIQAKRRLAQYKSLHHLNTPEREKLIKTAQRKIDRLKKEYFKAYHLRKEMLSGILEETEFDTKFLQHMGKRGLVDEMFGEQSDLLSANALPSRSSSLSLEVSQPSTSGFNGTAGPGPSLIVTDTDKESNVVYKSLDFIPPNLTTLTALRSLLLSRQKLMKTAGHFYKPSHYKNKRQRHLHIIIDSDEETPGNDNRGDGSVQNGRNDAQPKVKAIQVVEEKEGMYNDSWFKTEVDEELKASGNLPSKSFAPFDASSPMGIPNPRYSESKQCQDMILPPSRPKPVKFPRCPPSVELVTLKEVEGSGYKIMYGPSMSNVERMLKNNCNVETADKESTEKNIEKRPEPCENPRAALSQDSQGQGKKRTSGKALEQKELRTYEKKYRGAVKVVEPKGKERAIGSLGEQQNEVSSIGSLDRIESSTTNSTLSHEDPLNSATKDVDGLHSDYPSHVSARQSDLDPLDETVDNERVLQTVRHLSKRADNLMNVVVVGVNLESKKVSHYNVSDLKAEKTRAEYEKDDNQTQRLSHEDELYSCKSSSLTNNSISLEVSDNPGVSRQGKNRNDPVLLVSSSDDSDNDERGTTEAVKMAPLTKSKISISINDNLSVKSASDKESTSTTHRPPDSVHRLIKSTPGAQAKVENVVVVGLDPNSGGVVHFKSQKGSIVSNACKIDDKSWSGNGTKEKQPTEAAEVEVPVVQQQPEVNLTEYMTDYQVTNVMTNLRQTEDYKRLLARFRALFLWPVLMSTLPPKAQVQLVNVPDPSVRVTKKSRQIIKKKKEEEEKERTTVTANGKLMGRRIDGRKKAARLRKAMEMEQIPMHVAPPKKKNVEVKKRRAYSQILPKRNMPRRSRKQRVELPKAKRAITKRAKELPDWWKDAVTAVMVTRKAIDDGVQDKEEVDIDEDEDFVDKGNYSDDEWLVEYQQEEEKGLRGEQGGGVDDDEDDDNDDDRKESVFALQGLVKMRESVMNEMLIDDEGDYEVTR